MRGAAIVALILLAQTVMHAVILDVGPEPRVAAAVPGQAVALPLEDTDRDTYGDAVDRVNGDLMLRIQAPTIPETLLVVGSQDDHLRFGQGRAREWLHVYDVEPLAYRAGSPEWMEQSLRTGTWMRRDLSTGADLWYNIRDDADAVRLRFELYPDDGPRQTQDVLVDLAGGAWSMADQTAALGAPIDWGGTWILGRGTDISLTDKQALAKQNAPTLLFADGERFFPTTGETLERFHGFYPVQPNHETWSRAFNNGQARYQLLLADFTGDGHTDFHDAALMGEVLRSGTRDTVYAHVTRGDGDQVIIQYWFLYLYNFVLDTDGDPVDYLVHAGDREMVTFLFDNHSAAQAGEANITALSQHYEAQVVQGAPDAIYVARGSHASYPEPGRSGGIADRYLGDGEVWQDYHLEVLTDQSWAYGHIWGPATRFHRDLGTGARPFLQHSFTYSFHDPLDWIQVVGH